MTARDLRRGNNFRLRSRQSDSELIECVAPCRQVNYRSNLGCVRSRTPNCGGRRLSVPMGSSTGEREPPGSGRFPTITVVSPAAARCDLFPPIGPSPRWRKESKAFAARSSMSNDVRGALVVLRRGSDRTNAPRSLIAPLEDISIGLMVHCLDSRPDVDPEQLRIKLLLRQPFRGSALPRGRRFRIRRPTGDGGGRRPWPALHPWFPLGGSACRSPSSHLRSPRPW